MMCSACWVARKALYGGSDADWAVKDTGTQHASAYSNVVSPVASPSEGQWFP